MANQTPVIELEKFRTKSRISPRNLMIGQIVLFASAWLILTLASITPRPTTERLLENQIGEPASRTIRAGVPIKIEDREKTEKKRREAEELVPPTFRRIGSLAEESSKQWKALVQLAEAKRGNIWSNDAINDASKTAQNLWDRLSRDEKNLLSERIKDPTWRDAVGSKISKVLQDSDILKDVKYVRMLRPDDTTMRKWRLKQSDGVVKDRLSGVAILSVTEQRQFLVLDLAESYFPPNDTVGRSLISKIAEVMINPTIEFDEVATHDEQQAARAQVASVSIEYKKGQNLVLRGEPVTEEQYLALSELKSRMESRSGEFLGRAILVLVLLIILYGYLSKYHRGVFDCLPRLGALLSQLALIAWIGYFTIWLSELNPGGAVEGTISQVGYLIPVAGMGLLVTILESARLGIFAVMTATFLIGVPLYWDFSVLMLLAVTGMTAVSRGAGANKRSQIYLIAPWIIGSGILVAIGMHLGTHPSSDAFFSNFSSLMVGVVWITANGCLSVGLALLLLPLFEDLLNVTTDFNLKELSIDHPLLRQLEEKAPGTYYHSINVSALAEAAAASIGANALLVKVSSYYHDIGKMEKPGYFAENQFTREDREKHSKISPHMSCLIIRNHVKLGLKMAKEQRLPEAILPFIAEHHGTTLLSFFYDQARAEDPHGSVSEADFRYSGPKPQTIESAIVMMADTIEAASRSLRLVGEGEVRKFVKRMINEKQLDNQFDECNLTMKQIKTLTDSFTRTLLTMMHRRIAYPSFPTYDSAPAKRKDAKVVEATFGSQ